MGVTVNEFGPPRKANPALSVVLSTYNQPEWLRKSLLGYQRQNFADIELLIADDGSDSRTLDVVRAAGAQSAFPIRHLWHPDQGFRKCTILNRAIERARADYLVFSDGDCIPRADFLAMHAGLRRKGRFLSGGYCKLPRSTSELICDSDIAQQFFVRPEWLRRSGTRKVDRKLLVQGASAILLDWISTARASWNGHNASGWKADIERVNGFDERMAYGGQDREFGERLENAGIRGRRIRHRAICVHLDHPRGYATEASIAANRAIRAEVRRQRLVWTESGLRRGKAEATLQRPEATMAAKRVWS